MSNGDHIKTDILMISIQTELDVIGPKYLHYVLLHASFRSVLLFLPSLENKAEKLAGVSAFVRRTKPKIIGLSLMTSEFSTACYLTRYLKNEFPAIPIVWGGIHATLDPVGCLEHADYACIGEGEQTIVDIAQTVTRGHADLRSINNLCFKDGSTIKRNPLYPLIRDLDTLPIIDHMPQYSFIQSNTDVAPLTLEALKKYTRYRGTTYNLISSRGCPFSCTYCCNNAVNRLYGNHHVRYRSVENIIKEIEKAITAFPDIQTINIQDDCFLSRPENKLKRFCSLYRERINRPFIIRSIPIFINEKKIRMLKDAGVGWISLGLQSGSDKTCRDIYKRKSLKNDFLKAARIITKYRIAAFYDVILDNPFETDHDRIETINTLLETPKPYYAELFSLTFYLGTELYERYLQNRTTGFEDAKSKDYLRYENNPLNTLTRMATVLGKKQIKRLVTLYQHDPDSWRFKWLLMAAKLQAAFIFEPLMYFKVIYLANNQHFFKMLGVLKYYFSYGMDRYLKQFTR